MNQDYSFEKAMQEARAAGRPALLEKLQNNLKDAEIPAEAPETLMEMENVVVRALKTVKDPEIPVNLYDLGLIYTLKVDKAGEQGFTVHVEMTLTAPNCPIAGEMPYMVEETLKLIPGVKRAKVELVWEPAWDKSRMSEAALLELGFL